MPKPLRIRKESLVRASSIPRLRLPFNTSACVRTATHRRRLRRDRNPDSPIIWESALSVSEDSDSSHWRPPDRAVSALRPRAAVVLVGLLIWLHSPPLSGRRCCRAGSRSRRSLGFLLSPAGSRVAGPAGVLFSLTTTGAAGASNARNSSGTSRVTGPSPTLTSDFAVANPNISTVYCQDPGSMPPS